MAYSALYFLLGGMQDHFRYLNVGLGAILAFVGMKMILAGNAFDVHISTAVSLSVIAVVLAIAVGASIWADARIGQARGADPKE